MQSGNAWEMHRAVTRPGRMPRQLLSGIRSIDFFLLLFLGRASSEPHSYVLTWLSVTIYIGIDGTTSVFDPAPGVKVGCCGQNLRVVTLCENDLLYFTMFTSSSNSSLMELRRSLAFDCQHWTTVQKILGLRNWMPSSQRSRDFLLSQGQPASKYVLLFSDFLAHRESLFDKTTLSLQLTVV